MVAACDLKTSDTHASCNTDIVTTIALLYGLGI